MLALPMNSQVTKKLTCQTSPDDLRPLRAPWAKRVRKKGEKVWPKAPASVFSLKSSGNIWHVSYNVGIALDDIEDFYCCSNDLHK